jgi:hypothetical protein
MININSEIDIDKQTNVKIILGENITAELHV